MGWFHDFPASGNRCFGNELLGFAGEELAWRMGHEKIRFLFLLNFKNAARRGWLCRLCACEKIDS